MYEIIIAILIIIIFLIIMGTQKRIDTLRDSYTEFLTQHALYVKAVGDHSEAVQRALEDLDKRIEEYYYVVCWLQSDVDHLKKGTENES